MGGLQKQRSRTNTADFLEGWKYRKHRETMADLVYNFQVTHRCLSRQPMAKSPQASVSVHHLAASLLCSYFLQVISIDIIPVGTSLARGPRKWSPRLLPKDEE